jgi:hypothetical protein
MNFNAVSTKNMIACMYKLRNKLSIFLTNFEVERVVIDFFTFFILGVFI